MKQLIFLCSLICCCQAAHAQADSVRVWNRWCSKKDSMMLFTGANNMIQVHSRTLHAADMHLKSLDNALRIANPEVKGDTLSVIAMPYSTTKKMRLAVIDDNTGKTIKTISFSGAALPEPAARIGTIKDTAATRNDIIQQAILRVSFTGSLYSYPYRIKQYTFKAAYAGKNISIPVTGNTITREVLQAIKEAPAGTILTFTDIKATCPECTARKLGDLRVKML